METFEVANWLDAYTFSDANTHTASQCMALADLNNDGDTSLIVADLGINATQAKLKVYRGTSCLAEIPLPDVPVSLVAFHMDLTQPRIPAFAVASGPNIYIYKNMKPYFKFCLPPLEVLPVEHDVWAQVQDGEIHVDVLHEMLTGLCKELGFSRLTTRSQHFLTLHDPEERRMYVEKQKNQVLKKQTIITCMTTLKKSMPDEDAVSCLVLGTESKHIYILDSEAFTILDTMKVPSAPLLLAANGLRDVEFRLLICCRGRLITLAKRGWRDAKPLVNPAAQATAIALQHNGAFVAVLMDNTLRSYSKKGKELWCVSLPAPARCLIGLPLPQHGLWAAAVGLENGQLLLYIDGQMVDSLRCETGIAALVCGTFGRGEHSLIINTIDGCLHIKILRRTATFELKNTSAATPESVDKKNKIQLFSADAMKERETARVDLQFQQDLLSLRLRTASALLDSLSKANNCLTLCTQNMLRLSVQIQGLGPTFQLNILLDNMSACEAAVGLYVVLHFDAKIYSITPLIFQIPMLMPGVPHELKAFIRYIANSPGISGVIRVLVGQGKARQAPIMTAMIQMPVPSEMQF